eukprot:c6444_g1_i1.p1 GENE.c6444_g1_i1~~c6444_g1_i1.p1  ORF type:complete len:236 (+),score=54.64 c6444_g1_i1:106-813(+)
MAVGRGMFLGVSGLVVKPIVGALDFFASFYDGIAATVCPDVELRNLFTDMRGKRLRQPRSIGFDRVLRPYSRREADGQNVLSIVRDGLYQSDFYLDHVEFQNAILMMTSQRLLLLRPGRYKCVWQIPLSSIDRIESDPSGIIIHTFSDPSPAPLHHSRQGTRITFAFSSRKSVFLAIDTATLLSMAIHKLRALLVLYQAVLRDSSGLPPVSALSLMHGSANDEGALYSPTDGLII